MNKYTKDLLTIHNNYQEHLKGLLKDYEDKNMINKEIERILINHLNKVSRSTIDVMKAFDKYKGVTGV